MLTILFVILMLAIFGRLLFFGISGAWGIGIMLLLFLFLPILLIGLLMFGLLIVAWPILILVAIVAAVVRH